MILSSFVESLANAKWRKNKEDERSERLQRGRVAGGSATEKREKTVTASRCNQRSRNVALSFPDDWTGGRTWTAHVASRINNKRSLRHVGLPMEKGPCPVRVSPIARRINRLTLDQPLTLTLSSSSVSSSSFSFSVPLPFLSVGLSLSREPPPPLMRRSLAPFLSALCRLFLLFYLSHEEDTVSFYDRAFVPSRNSRYTKYASYNFWREASSYLLEK